MSDDKVFDIEVRRLAIMALKENDELKERIELIKEIIHRKIVHYDTQSQWADTDRYNHRMDVCSYDKSLLEMPIEDLRKE